MNTKPTGQDQYSLRSVTLISFINLYLLITPLPVALVTSRGMDITSAAEIRFRCNRRSTCMSSKFSNRF